MMIGCGSFFIPTSHDDCNDTYPHCRPRAPLHDVHGDVCLGDAWQALLPLATPGSIHAHAFDGRQSGLYNGFLAAGLVWSFFIGDPMWSANVRLFFLGCVAVAGTYGALTVSKKIFFAQALPAIVAMVCVLAKV